MKLLFKLIIISTVVHFSSCKKDNSSDGQSKTLCELDTFIVNNYSGDAINLYYNEVINDSLHLTINKEFDQNRMLETLKSIQAVYCLTSSERDSAFNIYKIHGSYCFSYDTMTLKVAPENSEIQKLAEGEIPTGNYSLDNILSNYQFDSVDTFNSYTDSPYLNIYSHKQPNLLSAERELNNISPIIYANLVKGAMVMVTILTLRKIVKHLYLNSA